MTLWVVTPLISCSSPDLSLQASDSHCKLFPVHTSMLTSHRYSKPNMARTNLPQTRSSLCIPHVSSWHTTTICHRARIRESCLTFSSRHTWHHFYLLNISGLHPPNPYYQCPPCLIPTLQKVPPRGFPDSKLSPTLKSNPQTVTYWSE